ncbi:MAG: response regulator, partial [Candidatus Theseobacter exili]|nr:response regulator [Candidatus Theseobacter exili]
MSPNNITLIKGLMLAPKYIVDIATDGMSALKLIKQHEYDVILLDVMLPKMSGYEVCKKLREDYSLYELPILLMTAKSRADDIVTGFLTGANDYIIKPYDRYEILSRVGTLITLKKAVRDVFTLNNEMLENRKEAIFKLGEVAEKRSKETGNHVKRVSEYSCFLAKIYG